MLRNGPIGPGPLLPVSVTDQAGTRSGFESYLLVTVLAVATAGSLGGMVLWRRRSRPSAFRRTLWFVPVALLLGTAGAALNSYVGYVRSLADLDRLVEIASGGNVADDAPAAISGLPNRDGVPHGTPSAVRVVDLSVPDRALRIPSGRTRVLLPPGYDDPRQAGRRYPVVYLVHGYPSGGPDDWLSGGGAIQTLETLVNSHTAAPMIVVAVDGTAGQGTDWECLNVPHGPQLETYLTRTVLHAVDTRFRTLPDRGDRAVGGMSGGGFCALNLGLRNQEWYSEIISTETEDSPGSAGVELLGAGTPSLRANTPHDYLPTMRFRFPMAVMLHAGLLAKTDVRRAQWIAQQLAAHGQKVAVRVEPGEWHTWRTARIALPYLLDFAAENFTGTRGAAAPPGAR